VNDRNRLVMLAVVLALRAISTVAESLADWLEGRLGEDPEPEQEA
jgi:hypothetical protein